jgi:hypothetical protein
VSSSSSWGRGSRRYYLADGHSNGGVHLGVLLGGGLPASDEALTAAVATFHSFLPVRFLLEHGAVASAGCISTCVENCWWSPDSTAAPLRVLREVLRRRVYGPRRCALALRMVLTLAQHRADAPDAVEDLWADVAAELFAAGAAPPEASFSLPARWQTGRFGALFRDAQHPQPVLFLLLWARRWHVFFLACVAEYLAPPRVLAALKSAERRFPPQRRPGVAPEPSAAAKPRRVEAPRPAAVA